MESDKATARRWRRISDDKFSTVRDCRRPTTSAMKSKRMFQKKRKEDVTRYNDLKLGGGAVRRVKVYPTTYWSSGPRSYKVIHHRVTLVSFFLVFRALVVESSFQAETAQNIMMGTYGLQSRDYLPTRSTKTSRAIRFRFVHT